MSDSAYLVSLGLMLIFGNLNPSHASSSEEYTRNVLEPAFSITGQGNIWELAYNYRLNDGVNYHTWMSTVHNDGKCLPVTAALEIDNTVNNESDVRLQMMRMARRVAMNLPSESSTEFFLVGESSRYLETLDDLERNGANSETDSRYIAASAIEAGISKSLPTAMFKTKAEIVYLFVSESTPIESPSILLLKKTFIIVFGQSVPEYIRKIATTSSHIFLIKDADDIVSTAKLVLQQTCSDSKYLCDVNMYKETRKYSTCKSCFNVCAKRQIEENGCKRCPYMRIKLNPQEVMVSQGNGEEGPEEYVKDNKGSLLVALTVAITTVLLLSLGASLFICYRNHIACFIYRPRNISGNQLQNQERTDNLNLEDHVERETGNGFPLIPVQAASAHEQGRDIAAELRYINIQQGPEMFGIEGTSV